MDVCIVPFFYLIKNSRFFFLVQNCNKKMRDLIVFCSAEDNEARFEQLLKAASNERPIPSKEKDVVSWSEDFYFLHCDGKSSEEDKLQQTRECLKNLDRVKRLRKHLKPDDQKLQVFFLVVAPSLDVLNEMHALLRPTLEQPPPPLSFNELDCGELKGRLYATFAQREVGNKIVNALIRYSKERQVEWKVDTYFVYWESRHLLSKKLDHCLLELKAIPDGGGGEEGQVSMEERIRTKIEDSIDDFLKTNPTTPENMENMAKAISEEIACSELLKARKLPLACLPVCPHLGNVRAVPTANGDYHYEVYADAPVPFVDAAALAPWIFDPETSIATTPGGNVMAVYQDNSNEREVSFQLKQQVPISSIRTDQQGSDHIIFVFGTRAKRSSGWVVDCYMFFFRLIGRTEGTEAPQVWIKNGDEFKMVGARAKGIRGHFVWGMQPATFLHEVDRVFSKKEMFVTNREGRSEPAARVPSGGEGGGGEGEGGGGEGGGGEGGRKS